MNTEYRWKQAAAVLCGAFCLAVSANAQETFQQVYGGEREDAARGGVIQTSDGGLITVGESNSFGDGRYDVYVIRTARCGEIIWSRTYDFGGNDVGTKVRQIGDGGFIVVGSTDRDDKCCRNERRDVLLLRLDVNGDVVFAKTYGGSYDDVGSDVQVSEDLKRFYVAGRSSSFGFGDYDAFLMHVDDMGNVLDAQVYGSKEFDAFNSLALAGDGSNDIVAGGETHYNGASMDVLVARVDAALGLQWIYHYGSKELDEGANSIISPRKDRIIVAGYAAYREMWFKSGYILKLNEVGAYVNDRIYTNYSKPGLEFKEIQPTPCNGLAVTGMLYRGEGGGINQWDALLVSVDKGLNRVFSWVYGGKDDDEGWSLAVNRFITDEEDPAFIIAGATRSPEIAAWGSEDLYLIRTTPEGKSGCNEAEVTLWEDRPAYGPQDFPTRAIHWLAECLRSVEVRENSNRKVLCSNCGD